MDYTVAAERVADNLNPERYKKGFIEVLIFSVISTVIGELIKKCILNRQTLKSPGIIQRWTLRRIISRSCPNRQFYRDHGHEIYEAFLKTGQVTSEDEVARLTGWVDPDDLSK